MNRKRQNLNLNKRLKIMERDNYVCGKCKVKLSRESLDVHHIIAHIDGGNDDDDNLITLY